MSATVNRTALDVKNPRERADRGMPDLMRKILSPVQPGVVLVVVSDASLMMHARALCEECTLRGRKVADLQMPRISTLRTLYGTGTRDFELAKGLASADARKPLLGKRMFIEQLANCRTFNAWSNEGVHIVLEKLDDSGCISAEASIVGTPREEMFASLERLEAGAREKDALILLFVHSGNDVAWLSSRCGELIIIDKCEPGPEASCAFSLAAMSLESQHAGGIGRTMFEGAYRGRRLVRNVSTFIAAAAVDRCMWYLAREGESPAYIAELFGVDRTTVWRRLKSLPLPVQIDADVDPPEGWRNAWFPFLGIEFDEDRGEEDDEEAVAPGPEQGGGNRF